MRLWPRRYADVPTLYWLDQSPLSVLPYNRLVNQDHAFLIKLANARMPFGKYTGRLLLDLPEPYVVWFKGKGFPPGELGVMLASMYEIKANGLEGLLRPLVRE
jgi:uncharacterized protein